VFGLIEKEARQKESKKKKRLPLLHYFPFILLIPLSSAFESTLLHALFLALYRPTGVHAALVLYY
jgi:hypothetical protein